jgi:hypothetical protein
MSQFILVTGSSSLSKEWDKFSHSAKKLEESGPASTAEAVKTAMHTAGQLANDVGNIAACWIDQVSGSIVNTLYQARMIAIHASHFAAPIFKVTLVYLLVAAVIYIVATKLYERYTRWKLCHRRHSPEPEMHQGVVKYDTMGPYVEFEYFDKILRVRAEAYAPVQPVTVVPAFRDIVKEKAIPTSTFIKAAAPRFVVELTVGDDARPIGVGSRVQLNGDKSQTYLLTAYHVLDAWWRSDDPVLSNPNDENLSVSLKGRDLEVLDASSGDNLDFILVKIPDSIWSVLRVQAIRMSPELSNKPFNIVLHGRVNGEMCLSKGKVLSLKGTHAFDFEHTASTMPSWSGSPIVSKDMVVGIHTGAHIRKPANVGVYLCWLTPSCVVPESDVYQGKYWRRSDDNDEFGSGRDYSTFRNTVRVRDNVYTVVPSERKAEKKISIDDLFRDGFWADVPFEEEREELPVIWEDSKRALSSTIASPRDLKVKRPPLEDVKQSRGMVSTFSPRLESTSSSKEMNLELPFNSILLEDPESFSEGVSIRRNRKRSKKQADTSQVCANGDGLSGVQQQNSEVCDYKLDALAELITQRVLAKLSSEPVPSIPKQKSPQPLQKKVGKGSPVRH